MAGYRRILPAMIAPDRAVRRNFSIAIDGPAGSGKTTVARLVAARLGYIYVDTGAMYRAVTLRFLQQGIPLGSPALLEQVLSSLSIRLGVTPAQGITPVWLDNVDVSLAIRSVQVTRWVSPVSALPVVRRAMVRIQRELAASGCLVMEGRDITTVVLPDATTKIFLTAALRERAQRRAKELRAQGRTTSRLEQYWALRRRDRYDSTRADSPLSLSSTATIVDTTLLTPQEAADCIVALHLVNTGGEAAR